MEVDTWQYLAIFPGPSLWCIRCRHHDINLYGQDVVRAFTSRYLPDIYNPQRYNDQTDEEVFSKK